MVVEVPGLIIPISPPCLILMLAPSSSKYVFCLLAYLVTSFLAGHDVLEERNSGK